MTPLYRVNRKPFTSAAQVAKIKHDAETYNRPEPQHRAYRSIASVAHHNGKWLVYGGNGNLVASVDSEWIAWMIAEKQGMESVE